MGMALGTSLSPTEADMEDLYEIVDGQRVWPSVGEPETDSLYEVVNGERKEVPRMGALAGSVASFLVTYLNWFAWQHKLGFAVTEVMFRLAPDRPQRRPDLAFISRGRWKPQPISKEDPAAWEVVPNLAVEVVSPNNLADEIEQKIIEYFAVGVQIVWVIYPRVKRVHVYDSPNSSRVFRESDELDGGEVLPGFRLKIADLFSPLDQS